MSQLDYIVQQINVVVDGFGKIGSVEKMQMPKPKKLHEDFRNGGMLAKQRHAMGYDVIEFEFELTAFDPQVLTKIGFFSKQVPTAFLGALDGSRNQQHASRLVTTAEYFEIDPGTWEPGKKAMLKCKGATKKAKLIIDGAELYDIDIENDVYVVGGVDEYAWIRQALS